MQALQTLRMLVLSVAIVPLSIGAASAQTDQTGTGGGPLTTEKAPNTTGVGQTKPPSRDASPASVNPIDRLTPREEADDTVRIRACKGCEAEPPTTAALPKGSGSTGALRVPDEKLETLREAPTAKPQSDLDTVALASAHREQAKSMDEKTSGLWQSWLVSVCNGCGDLKPATTAKLDEGPVRRKQTTTGSLNRSTAPEEPRAAGAKHARAGHHAGLVDDLSPENIGTIRRMPQH